MAYNQLKGIELAIGLLGLQKKIRAKSIVIHIILKQINSEFPNKPTHIYKLSKWLIYYQNTYQTSRTTQ